MQCVEAPLIIDPSLNRLLQRPRQVIASYQVEESGMRVEAGDNRLRFKGAALQGLHPDCFAILHDYLVYSAHIEDYSAVGHDLSSHSAGKLM